MRKRRKTGCLPKKGYKRVTKNRPELKISAGIIPDSWNEYDVNEPVKIETGRSNWKDKHTETRRIAENKRQSLARRGLREK